MSLTITGVLNASINVNGSQAIGLTGSSAASSSIAIPSMVNLSLIAGVAGDGKVNQAIQLTGTLAASASVDIDLYALGGALDAGGTAYTMAIVKALVFQNFGVRGATVEADYIKIGGKGTTAGWTSAFGTNTDTLKIFSGPATTVNPTPTPGTVILIDSGATGYAVGNSTTNHILTLTAGANSGTVTYSLILVGATS